MKARPSPRAVRRPSSAFSIPALGRHPARIEFRGQTVESKMLRFAEILLELGLIKASKPFPSLAVLIETAIGNWAKGALHTELTIFDKVAWCIVGNKAEDWYGFLENMGHTVEDDLPPHDEAVLMVLIPWDHGRQYLIKNRCEELHARNPALISTALHELEYGHWRTVVCMTPAHAFQIASEYYDSDDENNVTPASWMQENIPDWVMNPSRRLSQPQLARLASREPLARATLDLVTAIRDRKSLTSNVGAAWHTMWGAILRWSARDPIVQIADDHANGARETGEGIDDYSVHVVRLDRDSVAQWLDGAARMLHMLGCVDRLIGMIAEPA